jgi:hypothetical protein
MIPEKIKVFSITVGKNTSHDSICSRLSQFTGYVKIKNYENFSSSTNYEENKLKGDFETFWQGRV